MKVQIPDQLKADVPPTNWGKVPAATPVVMAVVATLLAGLASSEMTRAQYDRALAAQQQSKAGDQWSFFQAKRLRGAFQRSSLDLLQGLVEIRPLDAAGLKHSAELLPAQPEPSEAAKVRTDMLAALDSPTGQQALGFLKRGDLPPAGAAAPLDPHVKAALDAVENLKSESELRPLLAQVSDKTLYDALCAARDQAQAFDAATRPVNNSIDHLENLVTRQAACLGAMSSSQPPSGSHCPRLHGSAAALRGAALRGGGPA